MLERTIRIDFSKKRGRIKLLNGASLGPLFDIDPPLDLTAEYRELGLSAVRTRAVDMPLGCSPLVDMSRIFPDPGLDERFPESYDFSELDKQLSAIRESGAAIILSLGERIDRYSYRAAAPHLPADKWARVAERILLRYTKGWAKGPKLPIKTVEIWPGADLPRGFEGGVSAYREFYRIVANHLKAAFPTLKVGGYSSGGFASLNHYDATDEERGYLAFLECFLSYIGKEATRAPLDFFSWRCRAESAEELALHSNYARSYLAQYGFRRTPSVVSELRLVLPDGSPALSRSYPAALASALAVASDADIDMMLPLIAHPYSQANGVIGVDDCFVKHKYAAFGVLSAYGELLRHGTEAETTENFRREIYSLAAVSERGGAVMVATGTYSGTLSLEITGGGFSRYSIKGMLGGGPRGEGFSTSESGIPLGRGRFTMKVGQGEIYLISLE